MASSLAHLPGVVSAEEQNATREALERLSSAVSQPRRTKNKHLPLIKDWCRHDGKLCQSVEAVQLLDVCSPAELLELCGAVESLHERCKALPGLEEQLTRPLRTLSRACESILGAQRGLDYFARTWEAFCAGNVSCPVCFEEIDVYAGNFLV